MKTREDLLWEIVSGLKQRVDMLEAEVASLKSPRNPYREWEEEAARRGSAEYARPKNVPPPVVWPMGPPQWPGPFSPGTWCHSPHATGNWAPNPMNCRQFFQG